MHAIKQKTLRHNPNTVHHKLKFFNFDLIVES